MSSASRQLAGMRRGTRSLFLLLALVALACGPAPEPAPEPVVDSVELILAFDEPVTIADDPDATSATTVALPPGQSAGAFDGVLDVEDVNGTAHEVRLHVQVE